jgi:hypothetical protein
MTKALTGLGPPKRASLKNSRGYAGVTRAGRFDRKHCLLLTTVLAHLDEAAMTGGGALHSAVNKGLMLTAIPGFRGGRDASGSLQAATTSGCFATGRWAGLQLRCISRVEGVTVRRLGGRWRKIRVK